MPSINPLPQIISPGLDYPLAYTTAGRGTRVLLIHGSLCDYRYWRWQIPTLSQRHQVMAPSLRGCWPAAFSSDNPTYNIAQHTRDLIAFLRQLDPGGAVHIVGHSRGAHVALEVACTAPELARSLTLADPGFRIKGEPAQASFQIEVVEEIKAGDIESAMRNFVDAVNGAGTWHQMVGWFKTMVKDNAYTLLSQIHEATLEFDLARAQRLNCPVLLLGGANSPARYGQRLDILESILVHVERTIIPLASHGMNLASPKAFNERLLRFF
ncbi:MAG: alpha/beta hydrolase, partial [Paralcaligenes sp.]